MELIYLFVVLFCFFICLFWMLFFLTQVLSIFTTDAPFVPIPSGIEEKIIESLKLNQNSILYDLGCGDARLLLKAVEKYPKIRAVGVEVAFVPYLIARFRTRKIESIQIRREDIFQTEVGNATHIFTYLYPQVMEKLLPMLEKKTKNGTRVVSCDFEDKNRIAQEIITLSNNTSERGKRLIIYTF